MKILNIFIFLLLIVTLSGCLDKLPEEGSDNFCPGIRLQDGTCPFGNAEVWNFNIAGNYTYNSNYVEVSSGAASLKMVDQLFSGDDFISGTHVGTYVDSNNNIKLLDRPTHLTTHVNSILPGKQSNLIGYWRMEGDFQDSSSYSNHGVLSGDASFSTNRKQGANSGSFIGTNGKVEINGVNSTYLDPTKGAASYWVNPTGGGGSELVLYLYADAENRIALSAGQVTFEGGNSYKSASFTVPDNEWTHVVAIWNKSSYNRIKVYVNGVYKSESSGLGSFTGQLTSSTISNTSPSILIDEISLWNDDLSDADIFKLYEEQNLNFTELSSSWTPLWDSIVGYWKMDGNWSDSSGNGNDLISTGSTFEANSKIGSQSGLFDTAGEYSSINDPALLNPSLLSTSMWVKVTGGAGTIRSPYNTSSGAKIGNLIYATSSNIWQAWIGDGTSWSILSGPSIQENTWTHLSTTYDGTNYKLYVNGVLEASSATSYQPKSTGQFCLGAGNSTCTSYFFNGNVDEVALWSLALTERDIALIYNRQKQKYAGHYDSPIIDLGASGNWINLKSKTTLPFMKELTRTSEISNEYSSQNESLSNDLAGTWHFNGPAGSILADNDLLLDSSGNASNGLVKDADAINTLGFEAGILNEGISLDGTNDYVDLGTSPLYLKSATSFSVSSWIYINPDSYDSAYMTIVDTSSGNPLTNNGFYLLLDDRGGSGNGTMGLKLRMKTSSGEVIVKSDNSILETGFYHIAVTYGSDTARLYVNGVENTTVVISGSGDFIPRNINMFLGRMNGGGGYTKGIFDEVSIWSRSLSESEIQQLYRRGANRLKYQVRSCDDAICDTEVFQGPDGTAGTYFSELHNNTTINGSGEPTGDVNTSSANFLFSDFVSAPSNNRYFQYRVYMESDDENDLCSGLPCMPELTSVEIGPIGRMYAGTPSIVTNMPISYESINSIKIEEKGSCSIGYQLSNDGTSYYFWSGSQWASVSGDINRNPRNIITTNIKGFSSQFGSGNLYVKSFLESNTTQSCSIDKISIR